MKISHGSGAQFTRVHESSPSSPINNLRALREYTPPLGGVHGSRVWVGGVTR